MELKSDNLASYQDADFEQLQRLILKERKRRSKASRVKGKLEKQANAIGYTLVLKTDGHESPNKEPAQEDPPEGRQGPTAQTPDAKSSPPKDPNSEEGKPTSKWNIGSFMSAT